MQTKLVEIVVNGERKSVPAGLSVSDLLGKLEVAGDRVAVELNKSIVRKRNWAITSVADGSTLEIVQFVGGG